MEKTQLTKKQIRDKIYYLKKTGQTGKYKRYLKQYRDYHSSDEEEEPEENQQNTTEIEEEPEENQQNTTEIEEDNDDFILPESEYDLLREALKTDFPNHIETLQHFFNLIKNEDFLKKIMYFFKDRQTAKNMDKNNKTPIGRFYNHIGF